MRSPSRILVALVSGVLILTPLAGCGGEKDKGSAVRSADTVDKAAFVGRLLAAMETERTAHVKITLGGAIEGSGQVRYGAGTDLTFEATFGDRQLSVILVGGDAYVRQSAEGRFTKVTKDDPVMGSLVDQLSFAGPREALEAIRSGIKRVEKAGTKEVAGVSLERFKVTVDANAAADAFGAGGGLTESLDAETLDFYVDDAGLLRRVEGKLGGQDVLMEINRWGEPVTINAPTGDELLNR